jgi:hypothetical protein
MNGPIFAALRLIAILPSVWSYPLAPDLAVATHFADIHSRQTPSKFHTPPGTCPVPEQPLYIHRHTREFAIDISIDRGGLSGYFSIVVDPIARTARTNGAEILGRGVHISPHYTVNARVVPPPLPRGTPATEYDTFIQLNIISEESTTPNGAALGQDYRWAGARPAVVMRVTQESYRGHRQDTYRISWDRLLRSAIAVFLVANARRGGNGCG